MEDYTEYCNEIMKYLKETYNSKSDSIVSAEDKAYSKL